LTVNFFHTQGHAFSKAKKLVGIELSKYFCDLQSEIVKDFKLGDRVEIVHSDVLEQGKLMAKADVILMHNVFEFFHKTEDHLKHWKFLMSTLKVGALLVTSPSLEQQFASGKVCPFPPFASMMTGGPH